MAVRREYIADLYRNVLGREGSEDEISGHVDNPGGEEGLLAFFQGSPEYTGTHGGTPAWEDVGGQVTPTQQPAPLLGHDENIHGYYDDAAPQPRAPSRDTSVNPAPYTGFAPRYDFSAFNTNRQQDPGKSAKDAFAMLANQAPPPPFSDRAGMAQWFTQNIRPSMDALGHHVLSVNEDGFTYTNGEGTFFVDFGQNSGAPAGSMLQRLQWNATPADDATRARYATTGSSGTGSGTGTATTKRSSTSDLTTILSQLGGLGNQYGGPGTAGQTKGPLEQVGQDPLSKLITGGLVDFIGRGGTTPLGNDVADALLAMIDHGGNIDEGAKRRRFESSRELVDKARRTMINDARGDLASRNLLSEPGIAQGVEASTLGRITENLGAEFARAQRDIVSDESDRADTRVQNALSLATGLASDQAKTFLAGLGEGSARQIGLANVALQSLEQNQAWNMFLAEFGLKRDTVLQQLQQGRVDDVMQLLNSFLSLASLSRGGYV